MRTHTITTEVEVKFVPVSLVEQEIAYPELEITFTATKGDPGCKYQRNGDPGWPPEPPEVDFVSAKLIKGDGVNHTQDQIEDWAQEWLASDSGYAAALNQAREDGEREREYHAELPE